MLQLEFVDAIGGQAIYREDGRLYRLSVDSGWTPEALADEREALRLVLTGAGEADARDFDRLESLLDHVRERWFRERGFEDVPYAEVRAALPESLRTAIRSPAPERPARRRKALARSLTTMWKLAWRISGAAEQELWRRALRSMYAMCLTGSWRGRPWARSDATLQRVVQAAIERCYFDWRLRRGRAVWLESRMEVACAFYLESASASWLRARSSKLLPGSRGLGKTSLLRLDESSPGPETIVEQSDLLRVALERLLSYGTSADLDLLAKHLRQERLSSSDRLAARRLVSRLRADVLATVETGAFGDETKKTPGPKR